MNDMKLLIAKALADRIGVSPATLARIRQGDPTFPKPRLVGGTRVGWLAEEVDDWLRAQPVTVDVVARHSNGNNTAA